MDNEMKNLNNAPQTERPEGPKEDGGVGPVIGSIIIIVIIIIGGLYFWGKKLSENKESLAPEEILNQKDETLDALKTLSPSGDVNSIEKDLVNTDLDNLDQDLGNIEKELQF